MALSCRYVSLRPINTKGNSMCFSATASFTLAALLLPAGVYSVTKARQLDRNWAPLAAYPIAFSIQQTFEGILWLGVGSGDQAVIAVASRGFLFFAHFFWLAWVPFSIHCLETEEWRRRFLRYLAVIGALFGLSMILPAFFRADWITVVLVNHSLDYQTAMIYDDVVGRSVLRGLYAFFILSVLLLSSDRRIRIFGVLILISLLATFLYFAYAFISVWCFFAATISIYIAAILASERSQQGALI